MSLQYLNKKLNCVVDVLHANKHGILLQVDNIFFKEFGQECPNYPSKFAISLCYLKKEVRNQVRDLTALTGSNTTLTIYYTSDVLLRLTLFLFQYGIHTKPFFHLTNCFCNISSLLFQVTVIRCKLAC